MMDIKKMTTKDLLDRMHEFHHALMTSLGMGREEMLSIETEILEIQQELTKRMRPDWFI